MLYRDVEQKLDIATVISSVFSLDQADIDDEEIIRRLKVIARFIRMKTTKDQSDIFKNWIANILQNRLDEDTRERVKEVFEKIGEMEVDEMVSNLGRMLEESINKKVDSAEMRKSIEIAKKLLRKGVSIDIVLESTDLSMEEIEDIRKTLAN